MESQTQIKIVAVVGASGSGKSSLVDALVQLSRGACTAINADNYFRDLSHLTPEARESLNFDHPSAVEFDRLIADLQALRAGRTIDGPIYDFSVHNRAKTTQLITPSRWLLVEGVLVMSHPQMRQLCDLVIFVDTPLELCLARRVQRDLTDRERTEASVREYWAVNVIPMYLQYIEPWRDQADLVIAGDTPIDENVVSVLSWLEGQRH